MRCSQKDEMQWRALMLSGDFSFICSCVKFIDPSSAHVSCSHEDGDTDNALFVQSVFQPAPLSIDCKHMMDSSVGLANFLWHKIWFKPNQVTSALSDSHHVAGSSLRVLWEPGRHENDRLTQSIYDRRTGWLSILASPRLRHHIDPDSPNYTHTFWHTGG